MSQLQAASTPFNPEANPGELARRIAELGDWFHNLNLHGVSTAPNHFLGDFPNIKWRRISPEIPEDLSGATVLDIGCNAGFYSLQMKRRGAKRVLGIDVDDRGFGTEHDDAWDLLVLRMPCEVTEDGCAGDTA